MRSHRTRLGYDVVVPSLPTLDLPTTRKVLFVANAVQIGLLEEKPIVDCVEQSAKMIVPNMLEFENVVADDFVVDMLGCSTHVSEPKLELEPASSN